MKKMKKLFEFLLCGMLALSAAGCEQSAVAGTDTEPVEVPELTDEEKQLLREMLEEFLASQEDGEKTEEEAAAAEPEESAVPAESAEPTESAKPEESAVPSETPAEASAEPEKTTEPEETEAPAESAEPEETAEPVFEKTEKDPLYDLDKSGHGTYTLAELQENYRGVDEHALDDVIAELEKYQKTNKENKDPEASVLALYEELIERFDIEMDQCSASQIMNNLDVYDEAYADAFAKNQALLDNMQSKARYAVRGVLEGPYASALDEVLSEKQKEVYLNTPEPTERLEELSERYRELTVEYSAGVGQSYEVKVDGKTYTSDMIPDIEDKELAAEVTEAIEKERENVIYPIYHELIENRNEYAQELGYENYIEYAYEVVYDRDYSPADVKEMRKYIGEAVSDLSIFSLLNAGEANFGAIESKMSGEEIFKTLAEQLPNCSDELIEPMEYLQKYELYTTGKEESRAEGAYLCPLFTNRAGFIYAKQDGTAADYETLTHEFGHFCNAYYTYAPALCRVDHLDLLEIHSQGLEMLMSGTLNNVFPVEYGDYSAAMTGDMIWAVISAVMIANFELECFENPDMTADEMNTLFQQLAVECLTGMEYESGTGMRTWQEVHHLFECPMYYISYCISALSALDLYSEYLENPEDAVTKYETLLKIDPDCTYSKAMKETGLRDMTKKANIEAVCTSLSDYYEAEYTKKIYEGISVFGEGAVDFAKVVIPTLSGLIHDFEQN